MEQTREASQRLHKGEATKIKRQKNTVLAVLLMVTGRAEEGKLTIGTLPELQTKSERKVNKL
jgi:hypothetical protein